MKKAIEFLRGEARSLRWYMKTVTRQRSEQGALATEYETAANLLEKLSQGGDGPDRVASAEVVDGRVIDERGLLTAALFVGINPKAAQQLVDLVMYIRNLETALQEKREQHAACTRDTP